MTTTVQKWGNSLGVRIPKEAASALRLRAGSSVVIEQEGDALIVRTARSVPTLDELVAGITPQNRHGETDWDMPRGKEVW